jgi:hypothetical protein
MVNGTSVAAGRTGGVNAICRRSATIGRSTPAIAPTSVDQAPAAHTTAGATYREPSVAVTTARPPATASIPATPTPVRTVTPRRAASVAQPRTTSPGRAHPSVGDHAAATRPSGDRYRHRRAASPGSTSRLGTPSAFWTAMPASNGATSPGSRIANRYPT